MLVSISSEKKYQLGLALLWLLMHAFLFFKFGVRTTYDSSQYLLYANNIADRFHFEQGHYLKYVGYPLFLASLLKVGLSLKGIIIIQTLLSGIATVAFYKTTRLLSGNTVAPIIATFLLIIWYDLQLLHAFVLTESLYISLIIFAFYFLAKAQNLKQSLWALPFLLYFSITRPNGFIAMVAYSGYLFTYIYTSVSGKKIRIGMVVTLVAVLFLTILVIDNYLLQSFSVVDTYEKGELIFSYSDWLIYSDKPIVMPPETASPLMKMALFVRDNTPYFFEMSLYRFLLFWGNVKPFFSIFHNLLIAAVLYPMYYFSLRVLFRNKITAAQRVFVSMLLLQQAFITTVTSEDWMSRFLLSLIAFVFMFGAIGLSWQLENWQKKPKPYAA